MNSNTKLDFDGWLLSTHCRPISEIMSEDIPSYQSILTEHTTNGVLVIKLNRPKQMNSISSQLLKELKEALRYANSNPHLYGAVVITSTSPDIFCVGADVKSLSSQSFEDLTKNRESFAMESLYEGLDIPIIAAVQGLAIGGGFEIALMCDVIYCSESSLFGLPEINLGIIPGGGGTQRLPRIIGKSKAMEMILTGGTVGAKEVERWGLVSKVFPDEDNAVLKAAIKLGVKLSRGPRLAIRMGKRVIKDSYELGLTEGVKIERETFDSLFGEPEQIEGMKAFVGKRSANFKL